MSAIIAAAHQRVRDDEELTMRVVAKDVGLTGPGLYRYVNSAAELRLLATHTSLGMARKYLDQVGLEYPDPSERLVAGVAAIRTWALTFPSEFRLAFASHHVREGYSAEELACLAERLEVDRLHSAWTVGDFFVPILQEVSISRPVRVPEPILAQFTAQTPGYTVPERYAYLSVASRPEMQWTLLYLWARVYGIITFEVFNQVAPTTVATALHFRVTIFELAEAVGSHLGLDRISDIIDAELARPVVVTSSA